MWTGRPSGTLTDFAESVKSCDAETVSDLVMASFLSSFNQRDARGMKLLHIPILSFEINHHQQSKVMHLKSVPQRIWENHDHSLINLKPITLVNKVVLEPWVSPAFAITYFCNHCNISPTPMVIHQSVWIQWPFFQKLNHKVNDP